MSVAIFIFLLLFITLSFILKSFIKICEGPLGNFPCELYRFNIINSKVNALYIYGEIFTTNLFRLKKYLEWDPVEVPTIKVPTVEELTSHSTDNSK